MWSYELPKKNGRVIWSTFVKVVVSAEGIVYRMLILSQKPKLNPKNDYEKYKITGVLSSWHQQHSIKFFIHRPLETRGGRRGRLLLRAPGPVPFGTCICSNIETNLSWTCHVYGPFEFWTSLGTSILLDMYPESVSPVWLATLIINVCGTAEIHVSRSIFNWYGPSIYTTLTTTKTQYRFQQFFLFKAQEKKTEIKIFVLMRSKV